MKKDFPRWTHASVKDFIKSQWSASPLIVEGENDRNSKEPNYAELRINGPVLVPNGGQGQYKLLVTVNILITSQKDAKYVHWFQDLIGTAMAVLSQCIPLRKIGGGNKHPEDDSSYIETLQLTDQVDVDNFGQIDVTIQTQQASVEANYHAIVEA